MDPQLLTALAVAGLIVGATGTWSPCGFSMIETIGPTGHSGGLRTTLSACATFAPFAVLGGAITFGLLSFLGGAIAGAGTTAAFVLAAAVAVLAAIAEARGTPIVPQVRRQLPVAWRATMPMPLAAAGYGVLLGLGFTTFVLSYGVWALMGVSLALGDVTAGLVVGVAFGFGRAVPIVALAPLADRRSGERACEAMAMRPGLLRGARAGDAAALLAVAALLLSGAGEAHAASTDVAQGSDPSVAGSVLVYEGRDGGAVVEQNGKRSTLDGTSPAVGGSFIAVVRGSTVAILDRRTREKLGDLRATDVDALAISDRWLVMRRHLGRRDVLQAVALEGSESPAAAGVTFVAASAREPSQVSRPALDGDRLVYAKEKGSMNSLVAAKLRRGGVSGEHRVVSSRTLAIVGPSIAGGQIAYVATSHKRQTVRVKGPGRGLGRVILRRRPGPPTLGTTAIDRERVYVTEIARGGAGSLIAVRR